MKRELIILFIFGSVGFLIFISMLFTDRRFKVTTDDYTISTPFPIVSSTITPHYPYNEDKYSK